MGAQSPRAPNPKVKKKRSASTHPQSETLIVLTSILLSNRLSSRRTFDVGINFIRFKLEKTFQFESFL